MSAVPSLSVPPRPSASRPLDEAIRSIPRVWFRPAPAVYWADFLGAAFIGWSAFAAATRGTTAWRVAAFAVAVAALYRAVLFIHEISHLSTRDIPLFVPVWNAVAGIPLLIPSFLYEGVHTDHHRQRCYGTALDPEYVPYARRSPLWIAASVIAALFVPVALAIRFGLLAPIGWLVPGWGRAIDARASALVINHHYVRRAAVSRAGRTQEVAAAALTWSAIILWQLGWLPGSVLAQWFAVGAAISLINAVRTLAAHRYERDSEAVTMTEQLLDSCTVSPTSARGGLGRVLKDALHEIVAPVGLRYHALHHWIPSVPYHNLGRVHRHLVGTLHAGAPYRQTEEPHLVAALARLIGQSRAR